MSQRCVIDSIVEGPPPYNPAKVGKISVCSPTHYERGNLRRHKGTVVEPTPEEIILQRSPTQCHWTSHRPYAIAASLYQRTTPGSACSQTARKSIPPSSAPAA